MQLDLRVVTPRVTAFTEQRKRFLRRSRRIHSQFWVGAFHRNWMLCSASADTPATSLTPIHHVDKVSMRCVLEAMSMRNHQLRHRMFSPYPRFNPDRTQVRRGRCSWIACLFAAAASVMLAAPGGLVRNGSTRTSSDRNPMVRLSSFSQVKNVVVWAATNAESHGMLQPVSGAGSTLDVEVGDLLNSYAGTVDGPLGLATASDSEGSSQAFVVSPSTNQAFSLAGSFTNLDGSAVLPDDQWGYVADQGFSESAALDAVNLATRDVYEITSLPGFSPALSSVAACPNGKTVV